MRGLGDADMPPRGARAGQRLALWAWSYQELPGPPLLIGHEGVADTLADLPYLPEDAPRPVLISDMVAAWRHRRRVRTGCGLARVDRQRARVLDQLATGGALAYLRNADDGGAFGLLHAVTSPLACELVLPWLAEEDRDAALGYVWQAAAALHVAYDIDRHGARPTDTPPSTDVLVERAVASGDEHAIKLTEAALRSFGRTGDTGGLLAAADACARLGRPTGPRPRVDRSRG